MHTLNPILVLLATTLLAALTTTALPNPISSPSTVQSPLDSLLSSSNSDNSASSWKKHNNKRNDASTTTTATTIPSSDNKINPATHGIPGAQSYASALSNTPSSTTAQNSTTTPQGQQKQQQQPTAADTAKANTLITRFRFAKRLLLLRKTRKGKRDCIRPVLTPEGEWDYTVAAGSDVC